MKHFQIHHHCYNGVIISSNIVEFKLGKRVVKSDPNISVDQFYSQPHNLRNGWVDTSPDMLSDPQSASHIQSVGQQSVWPSDTPDSVIHASVISAKCQTRADISRLKNFKPVKPEEPAPEPAPEPSPDPASDPVSAVV